MGTTRRFILAAIGGTGALALGWSLMPPRQRQQPGHPLPVAEGQRALNGWVKIGTDGQVTVMLARSEMGQGVTTALALLLAEELDADWSKVRTEAAPVDKIYGNVVMLADGLPFHPDDQGSVKRTASWMTAKFARELGLMVTGGSSSVKDLWQPMREAGAAARAMLVAAAAKQWGVPAGEIRVANGVVSHASGKQAGFGALAAAAAAESVPSSPVLKSPKDFKLIGQVGVPQAGGAAGTQGAAGTAVMPPIGRLDGPGKLDGTARYGIDVRQPDMLYAAVAMCPVPGGRVKAFDGAAAEKLPGVKKLVKVDPLGGGSGGVAVLADRPWRAKAALAALKIDWDEGPLAGASSAALMDRLAKTLDSEDGFAYQERGDVQAALKGAAKQIEAEYRAPWLAHATMEPMNCTAQVGPDKATVWVGTQVPSIARGAVAKLLGLKAEQVDIQVQQLGGGFGRRLEIDFILQGAAIAQAAGGVPVQTIWSREDDFGHDFYRPACVARFKAGLDAQGQLLGWWNASAGQAIVHQVLPRAFGLAGAGPDKTTSEGAFDQPYEWPASRVGHAVVDLPVPVGFWRSVGHSHQAFFKESFLDEVAHAAGQDPLALRRTLLKQHPRHLAVLDRAAQKAGWGQPLAPAADGAKKARGIALHQSFGSIVAQVVEASVGPDKAIRVHRVVCAVDCGLPVSPDGIRQQVEGSVVFALSAALYGEVVFEQGRPKASNFHDQPALRMAECPVIETEIVPHGDHPEGIGEPAVPPLAPALANALFALTGQRLRRLPLRLA